MAFQRPALSDLVTRIEADYVSRLTGGGSLLRRSVVKVLARVHAGAMHLLYGYGAFMAKQIMPDTAESEFLARWCSIWGVTKKAASFATFNVVFTGTNGTLIPAGSELSRSDGVLYTTNSSATIASGTATVAVTAEDSGTVPNVSGGEIFALTSPIAGISSQVTVSGSGIVSGSDAESDSAVLARLLNHIQSPPNGGSQNDYVAWALQVAGVTRAWCLPLYYGNGTVGLTFVRDNDVGSIIPDSGEVAVVQSYIDDPSRRPVTAAVTVFAPVATPLNFSISGITDPTVKAAVQSELTDLIMREASPGGTILLSHIQEAISTAQGETDHTLTSPSANVTVSAGHISTMGTITWS